MKGFTSEPPAHQKALDKHTMEGIAWLDWTWLALEREYGAEPQQKAPRPPHIVWR